MRKIERRYTERTVELRVEADKKKIVGYGAVFDSRSADLGGFTEIILPGAFDGVLDQDTRALFNHDNNIVLGRTQSGTLSLSTDDVGLLYEIDPPDTQLVRDMVISPMQRGDVTQSSFGFYIGDEEWKEDKDGITRVIKTIDELLDVSPVTFPAYPDTAVALRGLHNFTGQLDKFMQDMEKDADITELMRRCAEELKQSDDALNKEIAKIIERAIPTIVECREVIARKDKAIAMYQRINKLNAA